MAILKVARMGHPVLRQKCEPIPADKIQAPEVQRLIRDLNALYRRLPSLHERDCEAGGGERSRTP